MKNIGLVVLMLFILGLLVLANSQEKPEAKLEKLESEMFENVISEGMDSIGFVGIYITESDKGVVVDDIVPNGPAAKAGIKKGDLIIELAGKRVGDPEFLLNEIAKTKPFTKVNFKIQRKGKIITLVVVTTTRPKVLETHPSTTAGSLIDKIKKQIRGDRIHWGIKTCDIVPGLDEYFGIEEGVLIIKVSKGSFGHRLGLKPGDVIIGIDETAISDVKTFKNAIGEKGSGAKVTIRLLRHNQKFTISGKIE